MSVKQYSTTIISKWINGGIIIATANQILTDIEVMFDYLVAQSTGLVNQMTPMTLIMGQITSVALTATNSYNVNVIALLQKNLPLLKLVTTKQLGAEVQLIASVIIAEALLIPDDKPDYASREYGDGVIIRGPKS